eukprot:gene14640-biopygen18650
MTDFGSWCAFLPALCGLDWRGEEELLRALPLPRPGWIRYIYIITPLAAPSRQNMHPPAQGTSGPCRPRSSVWCNKDPIKGTFGWIYWLDPNLNS